MSGSDSSDFATDSGEETESSYDSEDLQWSPPKNWATEVVNDPALRPFSDAV